jgi:hypothetical protein
MADPEPGAAKPEKSLSGHQQPAEEAPPTLDGLNGQQRSLYESLVARDPRLATMYLGAVVVLKHGENPDRHAQAAQSIRELIEKLPRYLPLDVPVPADSSRLSDKLPPLAAAWEKVVAHPSWSTTKDWSGSIDAVMRRFLKEAREFFEWHKIERPVARKRTAQVLRGLDPTRLPLPGPIEAMRVDEWLEYRDHFTDVAHHRRESTTEEMDAWIVSLEGFLLDRFRPRTFDDQADIRRIIAEGENAHS